jgi:hypothetical protein
MEQDYDFEKACEFAKFTSFGRRGGHALLCDEKKGIEPQVPIPSLGKRSVCIATTFYSRGPNKELDVKYEVRKMYKCPHRKST